MRSQNSADTSPQGSDIGRPEADRAQWDYHTRMRMGTTSDEARSRVGVMTGMPDPKAPIPTTRSAPSELLPRLLGVQYDTQNIQSSCCHGRCSSLIGFYRLFRSFAVVCRREFESVFGLTRFVWGPHSPQPSLNNTHNTLCRNDIITNIS